MVQLYDQEQMETYDCSSWEKLLIWLQSDALDNTLYECRLWSKQYDISYLNVILYSGEFEEVKQQDYATFASQVDESSSVLVFSSDLEFIASTNTENNFVTGQLNNFVISSVESPHVIGYTKLLQVKSTEGEEREITSPLYNDFHSCVVEILNCASNQTLFLG